MCSSSASVSCFGSSILFAITSTGFFDSRRICATSSSPGVMPACASSTKRTMSACPTASRAWSAIERVSGVTSAMSTPPGVDQEELPAPPLAHELLAVARDARGLVHDGGARARQAVDERRLPDVREADDRHGADGRRTGLWCLKLDRRAVSDPAVYEAARPTAPAGSEPTSPRAVSEPSALMRKPPIVWWPSTRT